MSVRLAQSSFKAARSPVFSPLYNALMTTSEAAGGSATTDVMVMLRAAGKKAFFPATNPATGWWQDSNRVTQAALEQPVGWIDDLSLGLVLGSELVTIGALPTPTITDSGGSVGTWTAGTRTIANTVLGASSYPRFRFAFGTITVGKSYTVTGTLTGDLTSIVQIRLATSGNAADLSYNSTTGAISGTVIASAASIEFLMNGTLSVPRSVVISSLSIRELTGYHATQATSLNRPLYTKRVNLSQRTEDLSNAYWTVTQCSAAGTLLTESGASGLFRQTATLTSIAGAQHTFSIDLKRSNCDWVRIILSDSTSTTNSVRLWVNLLTGVIGTYNATGSGVAYVGVPTIAASVVGGGYFTVTFACTNAATTYALLATSASADTSTTRADVGSGAGIGSAYNLSRIDLRLSAFSAMNLPAYQRVGNGTAGVADYDTAGFRDMLYFDGTSDALATSAIDLSGTDQIMSLCNVLKVSDAAQGMIYETSITATTTDGSMFISNSPSATAAYSSRSRGTATATATSASAYAAPQLACLRAVTDISSDTITLYSNGVSIATSATDQGTGNYGNHALYIGARAGTSLWFKGYMIPGPLLDTTGIPAALLDSMAREQAALWGVAI
jgi:hypothetical protein